MVYSLYWKKGGDEAGLGEVEKMLKEASKNLLLFRVHKIMKTKNFCAISSLPDWSLGEIA